MHVSIGTGEFSLPKKILEVKDRPSFLSPTLRFLCVSLTIFSIFKAKIPGLRYAALGLTMSQVNIQIFYFAVKRIFQKNGVFNSGRCHYSDDLCLSRI